MKRLVDEEFAPGSSEALLAALVRATPPSHPAPFDRARILARLRGAGPSHRRVAVRAAVAAVLFAGAATAAVAVEHAWKARHEPRAAVLPPPGAEPAVKAPPAEAMEVAGPFPFAVADPEVTPSVREVPTPAPHADGPRARPAPKPAALAVSAAAKNGEDPAPVLDAIRALRSEGDPARAGALLADYLRTHPRSVVAEDALALSIESALARHDPRAASDLAKRYLAQHPNGRYRAYALRAENP